MRTFKIIIVAVLAVISAVSCKNGQLPFVSRDVLEASENENKELKESMEAMQQSYAKQNQELNSILTELSAISCKTSTLQLRLENEEVQQTQAEKITDKINALKDRIDKLEQEAERVRKLNKDLAVAASTIKELRQTVANQEKEIDVLKQTIADREATIKTQETTISEQSSTISDQYQTILEQKNELARTVAQQTSMLFQAGVKFADIADNGDFKISGKKNKASIIEYRRSIYKEAIFFYEKAAAQGLTAAKDSVAAVKSRMESL